MSLNDAQQAAVNFNGRHCLIVAGPGTGKTHTLGARIVQIIESHGGHFNNPKEKDNLVNPKALAITFTQKAAEEMQNRLRSLSVRMDTVVVGTFHQFCLNLLRQYSDHSPLPKDFKIASPADIDAIMAQWWPNRPIRERADLVEQVGFIKSTELVFEPTEELLTYQKALRSQGMIDLDDVLREALLLLDSNEDILKEVSRLYPYIFIDEYQDCNGIQQALLKLLATQGVAITAIGDPNQAIYGFRGSDVEIFHRFEDDFPGAKVFYLKENYRSGVNILTASTQVMATNSRRGVPDMSANLYREGKLVVHEATTDRAEAEYVAHQIENMVGGADKRSSRSSTHAFGDIAILYRLSAQANAIAQALDHVGIPYQIAQKKTAVLVNDDDALAQREEVVSYDIEKVTLLSLHAAKGQEFNVVFIIGCEDTIIPLDLIAMKGDIEEERRLFYVGMTRAKQALYLTYSKRRQLFGQALTLNPSPFLLDIKSDLKEIELTRRKKIVKEDHQLKLF